MAFAVTASPAIQNFPGPNLQVSLAVVGKTDPNPVLHYTTDLSTPTASSPVYTAPFMISETTIVKAIAINPDTSESPVLTQGYVLVDNPYAAEWAESGHGDILGEAFRHWDEDGQVSASCARCHGDGGLKDFGDNGVVDGAHALPLGHGCDTCHVPVPITLYDAVASYPAIGDVVFPSLEMVTMQGPSNICIACHQGRESGLSVDDDIAANPSGPYSFVNIHYYAAGATFFGAETHGGYEYTGLQYAGRNNFPSHEADQQSCVGCHMRGDMKDHRLNPAVSDCNSCHTGGSFQTLSGSPSANYVAIQATRPQLLSTIQTYASRTIGSPLVYDAHSYPYFFNDLNGNGIADPDELGFANRFQEFDAELLKASYNFQVAMKDPAGYIHNGVYIRQLLHDSLVSLGVVPSVPAPGRSGFNLSAANKSEQWHTSGHGDSTAEAFRHWDEDGAVPDSCARCHTSSGYADYIDDGTVAEEVGLNETVGCSACHNSSNLFADASTRYDDLIAHGELEPVSFPSGATGTFHDDSNMCATCHQGRASGLSIDSATPNSTVQTPDYDSFSFINRHYYAAGAIMFGSDVTAAYEYAGQSYAGFNSFAGHGNSNNSCVSCHMRGQKDHSFLPQVDDCSDCHQGIAEFEELGLPDGMADVDYDGDGNGESFNDEIVGSSANLYLAIQAYATGTLVPSSPIVYAPGSYPYWFMDTNADGMVSPGEDVYSNGYKDFDRELLRAAYNYHAAQDPCGDIHNYKYVLQSLYDSTDKLDNGALDGSVIGTRP
ncbi:MAG: chitobiase/beta-hexosaminidase C-terminal domain-containing protein [Planctomycetes bacterium]|nr:chitobiase/beta-hexosaminidase C-terminal domain-containing protein [Planctomycetota bacterium]MCB9905557.1 chitobiase/beta-hexosaminidase C-terminal domain-containing protein [Planctomycetota bacterium]